MRDLYGAAKALCGHVRPCVRLRGMLGAHVALSPVPHERRGERVAARIFLMHSVGTTHSRRRPSGLRASTTPARPRPTQKGRAGGGPGARSHAQGLVGRLLRGRGLGVRAVLFLDSSGSGVYLAGRWGKGQAAAQVAAQVAAKAAAKAKEASPALVAVGFSVLGFLFGFPGCCMLLLKSEQGSAQVAPAPAPSRQPSSVAVVATEVRRPVKVKKTEVKSFEKTVKIKKRETTVTEYYDDY